MKGQGWFRWVLGVAFLSLPFQQMALAQAPARPGQPYAEAALCARTDVILCEDFNYPQNFTWDGNEPGTVTWSNPALVQTRYNYAYGASGRRLHPASSYPTKPQGMMPSGSQPDGVWVANWDPTQGAQANGSTWGMLRNPGGNYVNGLPPTKDVYIRLQYYVTPNYAWPCDPKTDKYAWGSAPCYDNKILFLYPPEGINNPTGAAYDAGLYTTGTFDPVSHARFSDALKVRIGDAGENYKDFPLCSQCSTTNPHNEYGPFESLTLRNPHDTPIAGKIFRFDTGKWYTIELHYKLGSGPQTKDGTVEVWIDRTKVYVASDLPTCGSGLGDCSGIGAIYLGAYHNGADQTVWNGQQVIDNLVIATGPIEEKVESIWLSRSREPRSSPAR